MEKALEVLGGHKVIRFDGECAAVECRCLGLLAKPGVDVSQLGKNVGGCPELKCPLARANRIGKSAAVAILDGELRVQRSELVWRER
jgi:hypothetical protein